MDAKPRHDSASRHALMVYSCTRRRALDRDCSGVARPLHTDHIPARANDCMLALDGKHKSSSSIRSASFIQMFHVILEGVFKY
jgi:hypothetical protein